MTMESRATEGWAALGRRGGEMGAEKVGSQRGERERGADGRHGEEEGQDGKAGRGNPVVQC
jgi:hypothetical protein